MTDTTQQDRGSPERLPCPYCGGAKIKDHHIRDGRTVYCENCTGSVYAFYPDATNGAVKRWNTRAKDTEITRLKAENARLANALKPFAVIGQAIRENATSDQWLEAPLFFAGTEDDPQSMTLTGKAFNDAALAIARATNPDPCAGRRGGMRTKSGRRHRQGRFLIN